MFSKGETLITMESMEPRVLSLLGRISPTHFKSKIRLEVTSISLLLAFKKLLVPLVLCHLHTSSVRGREKSSDDIFVCERVYTSKRMLKKVGSFSKDPIPNTCVTVCGVSELDACAHTVCVNQHQGVDIVIGDVPGEESVRILGNNQRKKQRSHRKQK
ncbi:hypothetical protein K1719_035250 [Acacia pycnantha]|nr:hypothetical protein K1719_035250 [Acacia pycnantha]